MLDPDSQRAFEDLQSTMSHLTGAIGTLTEIQRRAAEKQGINTRDLNNDFGSLGKSARSASAAQDSIAKANQKYQESLNLQIDALNKSVGGLKSFSSALLDTNRNFAKYNESLKSFGDAAQALGASLGPIAAIAGSVVKGLTIVGEAALKQADNVVKAYDDLSKIGGAGGITTKQIQEMGIHAGLVSKDLGKLTGAIKSNSTSIAGLGANAAEGIKVFGDMASVGSDTIAQYSKLGVSQEELLKSQSDYVALQMVSGRSLKTEVQDRQKLQKASLEYQDNLLTLSQLTGEDVEGLKRKQKEASLALEWQISQTQMENKARRLEAEGSEEGRKAAARLREEIANRQKGMEATAAFGNKAVTQGLREFMATGTATSKGAQALVRLGLSDAMADYKRTIKEGGDANKAAAKFQEAYNKATLNAVDKVGFAASRSQEVAEAMGLDSETMVNVTQRRDKDLEKEVSAAKERVEAQKKTQDDALVARAKLTKLEIEAGTALERFLTKINPLLSGFNLQTVTGFVGASAAVAAATALLASLTKKLGASAAGKAAGAPAAAGAAKAAGGVGKALRGVGMGGAAALGGAALSVGSDVAKEAGYEKTGAALDVASQTATYAGTGAMIGSVVPGVGTAIGAGVGAAVGAGVGLYQNWGTLFGGGQKPSGSVNGLLDFIGKNESKGDYNVLVGGKKANLTDMTVAQVLELQSKMKGMGHETTAVGKYQIIRDTLLGIMGTAGVDLKDKFDATTQDKLGIALLKRRGLDSYQNKKLSADAFADNLSMEWASLPYRTGKSYYAGVGSNASHISRDELMQNLPQARYGGSFSGPNSGYLVALHGNETVIPNFRLPEMAGAQGISKQELPSTQNLSSIQEQRASMDTRIVADMLGLIEGKFDELIYAVNSGNNTQAKILKYSKA